MDTKCLARPCARSTAAPGAPHTSGILSRSPMVRSHSREVNNGVSPARPRTQPGHQPPASPAPRDKPSPTALAKDPGRSRAGSEMLKKGESLVTCRWNPRRPLKLGWGQKFTSQVGGECPDPRYREQGTNTSAWGQLAGVPGGGTAKGPSF